MRAELVLSRLLFAFWLLLFSASAWPYNDVYVANALTANASNLSADAGESPWAHTVGVQVANNQVTSNGTYPSADLSLSIHMDRVPVNSIVTAVVRVNNDGPDDAVFSVENNIPVGYRNVGHISDSGALNNNKIIWNNISVAAGERVDLTFRVTVNEPTGAVNEYKYVGQIIASDKPDPDSTPNNDDGDHNEDDEDAHLIDPINDLADLRIHKSVDNPNPDVGEVVTFTINVTNDGPAGADYTLEDIFPSGYSNITNINRNGVLVGNKIRWGGQWIGAGETQDFIFSATVNSPDCDAIDQYRNIAQITQSTRPDPDSTPNNDDGDQSEDDEDFAIVTPNTNICDLVADLSLLKSVDNATPNVGDTVTFTITINNNGPDDATNVGIRDVVPAGYTNIANASSGGIINGNVINWLFTDIAANDNLSVTFTADVVAPTGAANEYRNTAQISSSDQPDSDSTPNNDDGDQSEDDEDFAIVTPTGDAGVADLSLTKNVNNTTPNVGDIVTFTITVNNDGPDDATNVGLRDVVPAGYTNIANVSSGGIINGNVINWLFTDIAANDNLSVTFTADVVAPTGAANEYRNTAQINSSDQPDSDSTPNNDDGDQSEDDEDFAVVVPNLGQGSADLSLEKNVSNTTPNIGESVNFTITVRNDGPDAATNVGISDVVPAGFSNITNISNTGIANGNTVNWSIANLAFNDSITVSFTAEVDAPTGAANEYVNTAQISASDQLDSDSTPNNDDGDQSEDDEDNAVVTPNLGQGTSDLSLTKDVNNATPNVGDTVTFTISVSNAGPDNATNVAITDLVPSGYTNVTNISDAGTLVGNTISWNLPEVTVEGSPIVVTFTAEVIAPTGAVDEYLNTAQISASDQLDPDSTPNNDDGDQSEDDEDNAAVTPNVGQGIADLSLNKEVNNATPNVGDTVTFTITVNNDGPDDATNVGISDVVPVGYSNIASISNGGVLTDNTINWSIADLPNGDNVNVSFTADVVAPTGAANEYRNIAQISASDQSDIDSTPNNDDGNQSEDDEDFAIVTPDVGQGSADLSLNKEVNNATPNVGDIVTFIITVNNDGPDDATNVGINDMVPTGYSNIANVSSGGTVNGNEIDWLFTDIAANDSLSVTFTAEVGAPTGIADEYRNTAQISSSDQLDPDSIPNNDDGDQSEDDEDFAIVTPSGGADVADLSLTKTVNNAAPNIGDTVTFTVTVSNAGPDNATNVGISDVVPIGYGNIDAISSGGQQTGNRIDWVIAEIQANTNVSVTFMADVLAPGGVADEYVNTAQISASDQPDPDSTPNNDDGDQSEDDEDNVVVVPGGVAGVADLSLLKVVSNTSPASGDVVTFTVTVMNDGPANATNIEVTDIVPTGYVNIQNVSSAGDVAGNIITWSIANLAVGNNVELTFDVEVVSVSNPSTEYLNTAQITASDQDDIDSTPNNDDGDQSEDDEDNASVTPVIDPTGFFYCEDDGQILTGGSIEFIGGTTIVTSNGVSGNYQIDFDPGAVVTTYTANIIYPPGTIAGSRLPGAAIDLLPSPPAGDLILGSSDVNNDGILDDFSAGANPWSDTFMAIVGDQAVLRNNIPVTNCASNIIQLTKVAGQNSATVGSLVQYEINARTSEALPLTNIDIEDNIPGGFNYVDDSAIIIRAGTDGVLNTGDDVVTNAIVTGTDPIIFEDIDFAASEELIIRYFLQIGTGVVEGEFVNSATCNNGFNVAFCNVSTATVNVTQDPILERTTIIGKVFADRDGDGWQDNANATNIVVKPQGSEGTGQIVKSLTGRTDLTDPLDGHQASMSITLPADKSAPIELTTNEGTHLLIDQNGKVTEQHSGKKARGLTGQDLRVSSERRGNILDLTIINYGIHEAGIPGVRLATVEGLLVETDEYGRYHLADIDGGRFERGRNFILKVDPSTLPEGIEFTTENPRVLRITQGLLSKINFGVKLPAQDPVYKQIMQEKEVAHQETQVETRELTGIVDPVHFDTGKADIPDSYIQQLRRAIDSLHDKDNVRISVVGHTDIQPLGPRTAKKFTDNYGLSIARANQVAKQLSQELDIEINTIETSGNGPDKPLASNSTLEGMAKNRRVEINVLFDENITKTVTKTTYERVGIGRSDVKLAKGGRIWAVEDPAKMDPRLDVLFHSAIALDKKGTPSSTTFTNYSNYLAFIQRWQVDIYNDSDTDLIQPIATINGDRQDFLNTHTLRLNKTGKLDESLWYVLRVFDAENRMDETVPKRIAVVDADLNRFEPLTEEQRIQIANSLIGKTSLSKQRIPIHGSRVRINGTGINSSYVLKIDDLSVPISHRGTFATEQLLPTGKHTFAVNVSDGLDETIDRNLSVDVSGKHFFMVGLANLTVGENSLSGSVEPLGEDDHFDEDVWVDGRLAFYLKGKVKGKYLITAQLDTTEDELRNLGDRLESEDPTRIFRKLDPDEFYAVYGDDSVTIDDTDSQGAFYLRVDWDKSMGLWGNFNTDITGTEFAQYNRSLYGAKLEHRNVNVTEFGDHKHEVHAFASQAQNAAAQNEFIATGGSLYYLKNTDVVQGSEKVWVEVRNRDTEQVTENFTLTQGQDYDIDYLQGRIILTRPLSQIDIGNGPGIIRDDPLEGDDVFLLVNYEFNPDGFDADDITAGIRGKAWLNQYVGIGGTYINEERDGEDYELKGADVIFKTGKGTYFKFEYAESDANQTNQNLISSNGGISFAQQIADIGQDDKAEAFGLEARVNLAEVSDNKHQGFLMAWWKDRDAGFSSTARIDDGIETLDIGIEGEYQATRNLKLSTRVTSLDKTGVSEFTTASVQGDYSLSDRLSISAELRHEDEDLEASAVTDTFNSSKATLGGLALNYQLNRETNLYTSGQLVLSESGDYRDNAGFTVGASRQVNSRLALKGEVFHGDRGDAFILGGEYALTPNSNISINAGFGDGAASQIGTNYVTASGLELYGSYAVDPDRTDSGTNLFTFGTKRKFQNGLQIYSESQFGEGDDEQSIGRTYGLDYDLTEEWRISASLQTNDVDLRGGDIDRRAATLGANFKNDRVRFGTILEYRKDDDNATGLGNTQWVTSNSIEWQQSESLRYLAKLDLSTTHSESNNSDEAKYAEIDFGFAYRPVFDDRLNILGKYTFLYDLGTSGQDDSRPEERSHIFSLEGIYDLNQRWEVGAKYAHREGDVRLLRGSGEWFESGAHLAVIRTRYHFIKKWDALMEYRWLEAETEDDDKQGFLLGAYRHIGKNFKVGAGYNFTDFDDDLTDQDYESDGWFFDVVGKY